MAKHKGNRWVDEDTLLKAVELRKKGLNYSEIGFQFGTSKSQAYSFVQKGLAILRNELRESAQDALVLELARLDDIVKTNYDSAIEDGNVRAQDQLLKVHDRRAKLLGLDNPNLQTSNKSEFAQLDVEEMDDQELEQAFNDIFTS